VSAAPAAAEAVLGHRFDRPELLAMALTHPGAAPGGGYERLEFLGDRVLGLVVTHMLYEAFPDEPEGALSRRLAALVRRESLAEVARSLGLGRFIRLARGEPEESLRDNPALLADVTEAAIGALYLDGGLEVAAAFVRRRWSGPMTAAKSPPHDPKTRLQEWAQGRGRPLPHYRVVATEGPAHEPSFVIEVAVEGLAPVQASGRSKRAAETAAAAALLARIETGGEGR